MMENGEEDGIGREAMIKPTKMEVNRVSQVSQVSMNSQGSKRRNIFGMSKEKFRTENN